MKKESLFLIEVFDRQNEGKLCKRRFTKDIGLVEDWLENNLRHWCFLGYEKFDIVWENEVECSIFHTISDVEFVPLYKVKVTLISEI